MGPQAPAIEVRCRFRLRPGRQAKARKDRLSEGTTILGVPPASATEPFGTFTPGAAVERRLHAQPTLVPPRRQAAKTADLSDSTLAWRETCIGLWTIARALPT